MSFSTHILYKDGVLMIYGPHTSRNDTALPILHLENMTRASRSNGGLIRRLFLRSSSLTFQFFFKKQALVFFGGIVWGPSLVSGFRIWLSVFPFQGIHRTKEHGLLQRPDCSSAAVI